MRDDVEARAARAALWQSVCEVMHARNEWTEAALARAASTLPDGCDLRARLLVRDHLDAGGQLARREVCVDGVAVEVLTVSRDAARRR